MQMKGKMKEERSIRKKIKIGSAALILSASIATAVALNADTINNSLQNALSTHAAETIPQPSGSVIARGEDGVPWELYENGYLLFKPDSHKNKLRHGGEVPSWKRDHGSKIKYIGFSSKVYAPENSSTLFSRYGNKNEDYHFLPEYIDGDKLDMSNVTSMFDMFGHSSKLVHLDTRN